MSRIFRGQTGQAPGLTIGRRSRTGNIADIGIAIPLLDAVNPPRRLLADQAYYADSLRNGLTARNIKAIIPPAASRRTPYALDRRIHRRTNEIEQRFGRLKSWRCIATRYDRHAKIHLDAITLVTERSK